MSKFAREILKEIEKTMDTSPIETLVFRSEDPMTPDYPVKIIHKPSGIEVMCNTYDSQIKNKAMALVLLQQKLQKLEAKQ